MSTATAIETMDLPRALALVTEGQKVRRQAWKDETHVVVGMGYLCIVNGEKPGMRAWIINDGDLNAADYVLIREH